MLLGLGIGLVVGWKLCRFCNDPEPKKENAPQRTAEHVRAERKAERLAREARWRVN